jgi:hypothetical protein
LTAASTAATVAPVPQTIEDLAGFDFNYGLLGLRVNGLGNSYLAPLSVDATSGPVRFCQPRMTTRLAVVKIDRRKLYVCRILKKEAQQD